MPLTNAQVTAHAFLAALYGDDCFPVSAVDRRRAVLLTLCGRLETDRPADLAGPYTLTHAATEEISGLQAEFEAAGSEIETVARDELGGEFLFIARAYGFGDADTEELIAPRDW
ncbi:hypothetical protein HTV45_06095 [Streptomyces sp. CHD11]|uniref:DUF5713 family protein n=1 Tax=Streptomyces sp. CHD11 TaxID=2741325 RepID=UPI001BFC9D91|nr:DUF5713 family protein [Streptomyces sp. CHD11]MBT3150462.1 hypothetical protein [Streptomyces sp. CHD11]